MSATSGLTTGAPAGAPAWGGLRDPRKVFGAAVTAAAEADERIVLVSADSGGSSGFGDFARTHPDRYVEVGIAEHAAVGVAAGLATTGLVPVFCAIAPFVTCRPYEALRNDVGYMRQNVKVVGRNGGFTYSDLGPTHHSLEDFAITRMIPGMVVLAPQDPGEIEDAVAAMLAHDGPVYLRIGGPAIPELFERRPLRIGAGRRLRSGAAATVVTTGHLTAQVLAAADALAAEGVDLDVLGLASVDPLDRDLVRESAGRTGLVVTVEEHYVRGGLGAAVAEALARERGIAVERVGVPHEHVPTGTYPQLLHRYGLDAAGLAVRLRALAAGFGPGAGRGVDAGSRVV